MNECTLIMTKVNVYVAWHNLRYIFLRIFYERANFILPPYFLHFKLFVPLYFDFPKSEARQENL